jgi:predicted small metal-binding protein
MKEFRCKSLGNQCNWKHIENTEERLADVVAIHLRDVHGVKEVKPDLLGKIKNLFVEPSAADAAEAEDLVLKEYNCDLGPGCTFRYIAMTDELLVDGVAVHARDVHGIKEFTPDMMARVKRTAHEWDLRKEQATRAA